MEWIADRQNREQIELGRDFAPLFDEEGLIPCITVDFDSGDVLMFAWMNEEAIKETFSTQIATYYSRSRKELWVKGEQSGRRQHVKQVLVDCDQDVLQLKVTMEKEGACHRGFRSCFYREASLNEAGRLNFVEKSPVFDPDEIYNRNS